MNKRIKKAIEEIYEKFSNVSTNFGVKFKIICVIIMRQLQI